MSARYFRKELQRNTYEASQQKKKKQDWDVRATCLFFSSIYEGRTFFCLKFGLLQS